MQSQHKWYYITLKSVRTCCIASMKSYLFVIDPKSHTKLVRVKLCVKLGSPFEYCSIPLIYPPQSHFWAQFSHLYEKMIRNAITSRLACLPLFSHNYHPYGPNLTVYAIPIIFYWDLNYVQNFRAIGQYILVIVRLGGYLIDWGGGGFKVLLRTHVGCLSSHWKVLDEAYDNAPLYQMLGNMTNTFRTRESERKYSWGARLTPRWPQFPALHGLKTPMIIACVYENF